MTDEPVRVRKVLGDNIARIRKLRELTVRDLSARLGELGLKLSPSGVSEIENETRKVSVDELLIIAIVLNTSLIDLLTPENGSPLAVADGIEPLPPMSLELWLQGRGPWPPPAPGPGEAAVIEEYLASASWPRKERWRQDRRPEIDAIVRLEAHVREVARAQDDPNGYGAATPFTPKSMPNLLRMLLRDVDGYVNLLASKVERDGYGG